MFLFFLPRGDVAALLHERAQGEPEGVENPKLVGGLVAWRTVGALFGLLGVPFIRAEAADQEEHHAHADIGKYYAHPNLIGQRVEEGKHPRLGFLRLLYHYRDAQAHKGLREVYHFFPYQRYG